jgi:hypothetical protein
LNHVLFGGGNQKGGINGGVGIEGDFEKGGVAKRNIGGGVNNGDGGGNQGDGLGGTILPTIFG